MPLNSEKKKKYSAASFVPRKLRPASPGFPANNPLPHTNANQLGRCGQKKFPLYYGFASADLLYVGSYIAQPRKGSAVYYCTCVNFN